MTTGKMLKNKIGRIISASLRDMTTISKGNILLRDESGVIIRSIPDAFDLCYDIDESTNIWYWIITNERRDKHDNR